MPSELCYIFRSEWTLHKLGTGKHANLSRRKEVIRGILFTERNSRKIQNGAMYHAELAMLFLGC